MFENRSVDEQSQSVLQWMGSHSLFFSVGVQFIWDCCVESVKKAKKTSGGSGCILAHCMGLGKTLQVSGVAHQPHSHNVSAPKHGIEIENEN